MKLKKLLSVILAAVLLLGCMSITAFAASSESDFEFNSSTGTITEYKGGGGDVEIPATIAGVPVTAIGGSAFISNCEISSITIPEGVTSIGYAAFTNCQSLSSVTLPSTLLSIGEQAFDGCNEMSIPVLPENLVSIGSAAFPGGRENVSYDIPASVTFFDRWSFGYDTSFASITFHWTDNIMTYDSKMFVNEDISGATLHIPEGMKDAYAEKGWTTAGFASVVDDVAIPPAPSDPSGVDLSMLTTGKKIIFGTQDDTPVEWVIGGDGETGMSVPTGCIALVSSNVVASGVMFSGNMSNVYANSNLKTEVENAVTFTTNEQAAIQERTLTGDWTYGSDCDGVAGNSVTAKVWAPTTKDAYALKNAGLSAAGSDYWLCSPGDVEYKAAYVYANGNVYERYLWEFLGVRAALYLDLSKITNVTLVKGTTDTYILNAPETTFLTTFTLNKDYDDKYSTGNKTTAVSETVTYTITPISTGDDVPAFSETAATDSPFTFTIDVADGVGSADVTLPETITQAGDYWYKIQETGGKTAGVTYDTATYYLHLITDCKNGEFGVVTAQIHVTEPDLTETDYDEQFVNDEDDKIDTVSNSYGEGKLKITQDTTVDGADNDFDAFDVTVTFTLPEGTEITGEITYGEDQTVEFDENGVGTVVITLKDNESVIFDHIPDGTTYTVEQTGSNTDLGFGDPDYTVENGETDEDVVVTESDKETKVTGTISDGEDDITIANEMTTPVDVGVILESGAFIILALGAIAFGVWLIVSKRRKSLDAE